ncbi:hypothetical protein YQE_09972, partial [Dendroctonus ponderosae]
MFRTYQFDCCKGGPDDLREHFRTTFNNATRRTVAELRLCRIGPYVYYNSEIMDDFGVLMRLIRSKWCSVQEVVLLSDSGSSGEALAARTFINVAFDAIVQCLSGLEENHRQPVQEKLLKCLRVFMKCVVSAAALNEGVVYNIKTSRQETCRFFIYFHTLLELYYYVTILYYLCGPTAEIIEEILETVLKNLLVIFKVKHESKQTACSCVENFWLIMQLIAEKTEPARPLFWNTFNRVLLQENPVVALSFLKELAHVHRFDCQFQDVGARSERIVPNYKFLETKFKELLSSSNCESLLTSLRTIEPLICDLWLKEGKIEILQMIWDFYSKRLNVSQNSSAQDASALSIVEAIDNVMFCPKNSSEDFEMFVGILVFYLKEYPTHWGKIKGRIYSGLGPNKIKDLTETGIRHVMMLFLGLSSIYFEEIEKKMLAFLANLPKGKKYTVPVWNMYAAIVLKYVRESRSVEKLAPAISEMLQQAAASQKTFHLIKNFLENLESIINHSANMQLHQWLLFGNWLGQYQAVCYFPDLTYSLNVILRLLDKCSNADSWGCWEEFFKNTLYPNLKQLAAAANSPAVIGKIAGKLALSYNNIASEAFAYFTSETVSPKVASMFLEVVLDSYPDSLILTSQQEQILLQSWTNICFLTAEPQCELTKMIIKLDIFPPALKERLKTADDPMGSFLEYVGGNSADCFKLTEVALVNLAKTLGQYLANPDSEQTVLGIYKYASLAFLSCGSLIYNRNKPVTILTKLVHILLFPNDFMLGKRALHNFVLSAVRKHWTVFFDAFVKLNGTSDPYLERTLRDMVIKYLPYFPSTDSPVVDCLKNEKLSQVILEKISQSYFKLPIKESDANLLKALKIVSDVASTTGSLPLFQRIVRETLYGLFEVVIFHSQRSSAIAVIKHITNSPLFIHVRPQFKQTVIEITDKNIALNTINYFQLMSCLSKFVPRDIREVLETIKSHVGNVERLRGISYDRTLRLHLEKLEQSLQYS